MIERRLGRIVVVLLTALLTACASRVATPPEVEKGGPADFPDAYYRQLLAEGKPVFRVDPALSLVVIEVRRGDRSHNSGTITSSQATT